MLGIQGYIRVTALVITEVKPFSQDWWDFAEAQMTDALVITSCIIRVGECRTTDLVHLIHIFEGHMKVQKVQPSTTKYSELSQLSI